MSIPLLTILLHVIEEPVTIEENITKSLYAKSNHDKDGDIYAETYNFRFYYNSSNIKLKRDLCFSLARNSFISSGLFLPSENYSSFIVGKTKKN